VFGRILAKMSMYACASAILYLDDFFNNTSSYRKPKFPCISVPSQLSVIAWTFLGLSVCCDDIGTKTGMNRNTHSN
jgi:hypothetical protein